MEIKTPMVAEKLGVSPKVVMRIVQQLQISLQKNKNGHYVFSEEQVKQIESYNASSQIHPENEDFKQTGVTREDFQSLIHLIQNLDKRVSRTEDRIQEKADDVVNYQLLQHRKELEELHTHIIQLENQLTTTEQPKGYSKETNEVKTEPTKRKKLSLSMFGL
ncbi:chromosome segregation protein [Ectobacillus sp. sgz5001026]|uniref:chromosome segregation protein n=1 Tax=Ectobacillus sp. sgz5001026 TaxID=3242473 RepID=UPI0036D27A9B